MTINCEFCNKEYNIPECWFNRNKHHCCCRKCSDELKKKNSIKICEYCKKEFYSKNHQKNKRFCSNKCSQANKINRVTLICNICNKEYNVNKYRENISKFCSRKCLHKYIENILSTRIGSLSKSWKGYFDEKRNDRSKLKSWSLEIKRRDKVCVECGSCNNLQSHHIKPYRDFPDLRFDINNGILLCSKCHAKKHESDNTKVIQLIRWERKIG